MRWTFKLMAGIKFVSGILLIILTIVCYRLITLIPDPIMIDLNQPLIIALVLYWMIEGIANTIQGFIDLFIRGRFEGSRASEKPKSL